MAAHDVKPVPTEAIKNVSGSNGADATAYPPIVVKTTRAEVVLEEKKEGKKGFSTSKQMFTKTSRI